MICMKILRQELFSHGPDDVRVANTSTADVLLAHRLVGAHWQNLSIN